MDLKLGFVLLVIGIGLMGNSFYVSEPDSVVEVEELDSDRVSPENITMYSELSNSEKRLFRTMLNDRLPNEDVKMHGEYEVIELDGSLYEFDVYNTLEFPLVAGFISSVGGIGSLLLGRSELGYSKKQLFDGVSSAALAFVILGLLFSGGNVVTESQIAMSESPVSVSEDVEDTSVIDIQYVRDDGLRDSLFDSMRGGEPVSEESLSESDFTLIAVGSTSEYVSFVDQYEYVSSDGEYYKITRLDGQFTGNSVSIAVISVILSIGLLAFSAVSFWSYKRQENE